MAVHGDHILAEHYAGAMEPATVHLLISVSKSIVGILGGALAGEGVLTSERVTAYVPARASGYRSATLRHRLDLGSGIAFPRTTWTPTQRSGCSSKPSAGPRRSPYVPNTLRELLLTLRQGSPRSGPFDYRSCESDILAGGGDDDQRRLRCAVGPRVAMTARPR
jgi:CubicO group peptidase (beta-lactamase class C family)